MKLTSAALYFLFCILFFASCKKDPGVEPDKPDNKPNLQATSATVYIDGGVTLKGQINKIPANLTAYGFIVSPDSLFKNNVRLYPVKTTAAIGEFKVDINNGLNKNTKYFYTVYHSSTDNPFVFYNQMSFLSTGTKRMKIDSIAPLKAHLGDTLTVKGKYFSNQSLNLKFGDLSAVTIPMNDSVFKVIVTPFLNQANPVITIVNVDRTDTISTGFSLYAPTISSSTQLGTFRDTVTIDGDHFGTSLTANEVLFGTVKANIVGATRKQIKAIVPDEVKNSISKITVKAQAQSVVAGTSFQIRKPEITFAPGNAYINEAIAIKGKYFHPLASKNTVIFETTPAQINSASSSQLSMNVPNGAYPRRTATIKLTMLDYLVTYTVDMAISDKWVVVSDAVPFNVTMPAGTFTINNVSYAVAASKEFGDPKNYLWKFNPDNFSWQKINIPVNFSRGIVTSNGSKAYLYIYGDTDNFWEFNPATDTWTKKTSYIYGRRNGTIMFATNGKVYVGGGYREFDLQPDNTFYEFDIAANTWKQIANFPDTFGNFRSEAATFVINNVAYVGCGATNTGMSDFYKYNPATDAWVRIHDFPDARHYTSSFTLNGYGYVVGGTRVGGSSTRTCFKYDPIADTWTELKEDVGLWLLGTSGFERGFAFSNNGKAYAGGGDSAAANYQLLQAYGSSL
jgi:hypothetical protein